MGVARTRSLVVVVDVGLSVAQSAVKRQLLKEALRRDWSTDEIQSPGNNINNNSNNGHVELGTAK